jgi:hypothetical protein
MLIFLDASELVRKVIGRYIKKTSHRLRKLMGIENQQED